MPHHYRGSSRPRKLVEMAATLIRRQEKVAGCGLPGGYPPCWLHFDRSVPIKQEDNKSGRWKPYVTEAVCPFAFSLFNYRFCCRVMPVMLVHA
ncbi:MAG: hypothetical protein Q9181_007478 [Wetmoreana brouardii]